MNPKKVIGIFFLGLLLMLVLEIVLIWAFRQVEWLPTFTPAWYTILLSLLAITAGAFLVIWTVRIQYTEGKGTPYPKVATQKLITTGPYAYTRNPMTLGAAFFYLGFGICTGSVMVISLVLLVFASLLTYIYLHETKELTDRFGEDYLEYKLRTPFIIPCLRR